MDANLQNQLYGRYPLIFQEVMVPVADMGGGIATGNGWYHLIDGLCAQLQRETDQDGTPQIVATQVKEKLGSLRFYARSANDRQSAMIDLMREVSRHVCDVCGGPGALLSVGRLRASRCSAHAPPPPDNPSAQPLFGSELTQLAYAAQGAMLLMAVGP